MQVYSILDSSALVNMIEIIIQSKHSNNMILHMLYLHTAVFGQTLRVASIHVPFTAGGVLLHHFIKNQFHN